MSGMAHAAYSPLHKCLAEGHHVSVCEHCTALDWAEEIKYLTDVMYPDTEKIIFVMDNLNTYKAASLYKRYPVPEARRIIKHLEIYYTQSMEAGLILLK